MQYDRDRLGRSTHQVGITNIAAYDLDRIGKIGEVGFKPVAEVVEHPHLQLDRVVARGSDRDHLDSGTEVDVGRFEVGGEVGAMGAHGRLSARPDRARSTVSGNGKERSLYLGRGGSTIFSREANFYARFLLRLPVRDCTAGFRCYAAEVLETVDPFAIRGSGYSFLEEMVFRVCRSGFRVGEIPIVFENRRAGSSKIDSPEIYRAAWHVLVTAVRPPRLPAAPARERQPSGPRASSV